MLQSLDRIVPQRYHAWALCALLTGCCLALLAFSALWLWPALVFGALTLIGLVDFLQPRQAIRRNYPVLAHFRFFFARPALDHLPTVEAGPRQAPLRHPAQPL
jgi:hypothetical protein